LQGILGLAYPVIAQPDRSVLSWLEAVKVLRGRQGIAFALELCGSQDGADKQTGVFEVLGKTDRSVWKLEECRGTFVQLPLVVLTGCFLCWLDSSIITPTGASILLFSIMLDPLKYSGNYLYHLH
jgi:hypothetical protein